MRILLCVSDLTKGRGGAERVAAEMAAEMCRRGHDVAIYSDAESDEESAYPLHPDIIHLKHPLRRGNNLATAREIIREFKPDVGFIFYYNIKLIPLFALLEPLNIPIGLQECTNPVRAVGNLTKYKSVEDMYEAYAIRAAFMTACHAIRLTMDSYAKFTPKAVRENIFTFKNPFPVDKTPKTVKLSGKTKDESARTIVNIGGLKGANKNGVVLARAFANLSDEFPNWQLKFFGKSNLPEVDEIIESKDLQNRLIVAGTVDNIHEEYRAADIHVICSLHEGCPNVVCEAMGHGIPSIGYSDCRGTNELIVNGINGLLIDRLSEVENLEIALRTLMSNPKLRKDYGQQAHLEAKELFPAEKVYDRWEGLFVHMGTFIETPSKLLSCHRRKNLDEARNNAIIRKRAIENYLYSNNKNYEPQNHEPLVSVIIPLFNKEKYIENTLNSVLRSSYKNLEVLVINDCSTDRSQEIVERFLNDKRVSLIHHKENSGLSTARNTGLKNATGVYIQFWDADDELDVSWLSRSVDKALTDFSDIITGVAYRNGAILPWYIPSEKLLHSATFETCSDVYSASSTCFKLYRHAFLKANNMSFVDGLYMQDTEFNLRAMPMARSISMTPYPVGEYLATDDSASSIVSRKRADSCFKIDNLTRVFYEEEKLMHLDGFRSDKIIRFVFNFFVARLIDVTQQRTNENARKRLGSDFTESDAEFYLERFRKHVRSMSQGLVYMSEKHGRRALAYLAFAINRDQDFRAILSQANLSDEILAHLYENDLGLSLQTIFLMIERAGFEIPDTHKPIAL